jgi:hypothetical protein
MPYGADTLAMIRTSRAMSEMVMSDKTHVEHNESALALVADIPGDMDFRCNGP